MTEDSGYTMTAPTMNGDKPLPRRAGVRGMLPSTWISRTVKIEYVGAAGDARETTATLLDWCPVGILIGRRRATSGGCGGG